jgi:hypothetical protein
LASVSRDEYEGHATFLSTFATSVRTVLPFVVENWGEKI